MKYEHFDLGRILRTSNQFPRPPFGPNLTDTGQPEPQNYRDLGERLGGNRGPCSPWNKKNTIHNGTDRDKVEGDGGSNGCTNET